MRKLLIFLSIAGLAACQQPRTVEPEGNSGNGVDPGQPAAVTPAISGAEGEAIAEEQRKAAATGNESAPH